MYDLYGICNHSGGTLGGHYTSYVKNANDNWYLYNVLSDSIPEKLLKYYLVENNIKTVKQLRNEMDIGVLYIRK